MISRRRSSSGTFFGSTKAALKLLSPRDRKRFWILVIAQMSAGLLDLIGAGLITLVVFLLVGAFEPNSNSDALLSKLNELQFFADYSLIKLAVVSGIGAALFFLIKSMTCLWLIRKNLVFLGNQHSQIVSRLADRLLKKNLLFIESKSSQETSNAILHGTSYLTIELLGPLAIGLSEATLLILFAALMLWINPILMLCTVIFFGSAGVLLHRILGRWAGEIGAIVAQTSSDGQRELQETIGNFRSITVFGRQEFFVKGIRMQAQKGALAHSTKRFIEQIPKFSLEVTLVLGVLALGISQVSSSNLVSASTTLALFLTIAVRSTPSMLRLQGVFIAMRNATGQAKQTLDFIERLDQELDRAPVTDFVREHNAKAFSPELKVSNLSFIYPNNTYPSISNVSFTLNANCSLAIVGKSGAGKSTLVDLLLGLLVPQEGTVLLNGVAPQIALELWRDKIAYVPQETKILSKTILENIVIGIPENKIDFDAVWLALEQVQMDDFVKKLPSGLYTQIGESGLKLSGGQRQRLGLTRAFYLNPELLILDEATSALDPETENHISLAISAFSKKATVVSIAHRLATVRAADYVLYLENGKCQAFGTFQEVRDGSPDFATHAKLLGL
ncbi:MAG: ABC transporter ATP-binding protein/permease [Candidatus Planktophila sp.]|nr:ABC transporter ATP-binding protein/permease [Candidatus Planktophila sp.]